MQYEYCSGAVLYTKIGGIPQKKESPVQAAKGLRGGFPFSYPVYFICTPSIALPRMPA